MIQKSTYGIHDIYNFQALFQLLFQYNENETRSCMFHILSSIQAPLFRLHKTPYIHHMLHYFDPVIVF